MGNKVFNKVIITVPSTEQALADKQKLIDLIKDIEAEKAPHGMTDVFEIFAAKPNNRQGKVDPSELELFQTDEDAWRWARWGCRWSTPWQGDSVIVADPEQYIEQLELQIRTNNGIAIWAFVAASQGLGHSDINIDMSNWHFSFEGIELFNGDLWRGQIQQGLLMGYEAKPTDCGTAGHYRDPDEQPSLNAKWHLANYCMPWDQELAKAKKSPLFAMKSA